MSILKLTIVNIAILCLFAASLAYADNAESEKPTSNILVVAGMSMYPTFEPGDKVSIQYNFYKAHEIKRGDLVAIHFRTRKHLMLKRVVAASGDIVGIKDGYLKVNGENLVICGEKSRRRLSRKASRVLLPQLRRYGNKIPKGYLIVLGDNADNSFDSGSYGLINEEQVAGLINKVAN